MPRPQRPRIRDELQALRTLLDTPEQFAFLPAPGRGNAPTAPLAILSAGPAPAAALQALPRSHQEQTALVVEAPGFLEQMDASWREALPSHWRLAEASRVAPLGDLLIYLPALRLFPSFWSPILAAVELARRPPSSPCQGTPLIAIPGDERALLQRELEDAAQRLGFAVAPQFQSVRELLDACRPALFFSVNLRGLDPWGEDYHLLRAAGTRVALWCVDTPWHLLSQCKAAWWKQAPLFVTDASFVPDLESQGAAQAHHLPLAGWPQGFAPSTAAELAGLADASLHGRGLFVGRTAFPNRERFFAGHRLPQGTLEEAIHMLHAGERPDYWWWLQRLGVGSRWPGNDVRQAGLGAAETSLLWRTMCVQAMGGAGPAIVVGDAAWERLLGEHPLHELRPPVDYYGPLAAMYRDAAYVCNATNLLLPEGCTQRHFDVWLAGGLLVTDDHPGLGIFPQTLTAPIAFRRAQDLPRVANTLMANAAEISALSQAWREEIIARHTYAHRLQRVLAAMGL